MRNGSIRLAALALIAAPVALAVPAQAAPPAAKAAAGNQQQAAMQFIDNLADQAFAVLRDKSLNRTQVKAKFRQMLRQNFAVDEIGTRLIRRHRATITPAQHNAYLAAFPDYIIDTYADRLFEYADSDVKIIRALPRGSRGDMDVYTRIVSVKSTQPIEAIWSVKRQQNGQFQISNLTVAGVNLALTQEADFDAYIQRNGFDALVNFMRTGKKA